MHLIISKEQAIQAASIFMTRAFLLDQCAYEDHYLGFITDSEFEEGKKQGERGIMMYEWIQKAMREVKDQ